MEKIKIYISMILISGILFFSTGCNDYLDRDPLDGFTDDTYWTSEANVKTYAWLFYDQFKAYGIATGTTAEFYFQSSNMTSSINISDDLTSNTFLPYQLNPGSSNSDWKDLYEYIRRANVMFARIPDVPMEPEAAEHWEGVARFFRSLSYYKLVQRFGDVPYYDKVVDDPNDAENIYIPRMDRNEVMEKVWADITRAVDILREEDEANSVTKYVALALQARIGLYEGTYRKYHQAGGGTAFLQGAKEAANALITSGKYAIQMSSDGFKAVYNSEDLGGNSEIILYKNYSLGILANSIQAYTNTSTVGNGMTKAAFESYVCVDGLPISQSPLYQGDETLENAMAARDPRLLATVDSEGVSFQGSVSSLSRARKSSTGYVIHLYYNENSANVTTTGQNTIDAPVFSYAEVLLNYAEACAELGNITQNDLDISVNILRNRAGITPLTYVSDEVVMVDGVTIHDPKRTSALEQISGVVPSIIWEIRRDRRAELMTWNAIRYYDLMRWKKGDYLDYTNNPDVALGVKGSALAPEDVATLNEEGYVYAYPESHRTFNPEKNYLNAIPTGQIDLYVAEGISFPQNPGW
ncbi:MAG: RagB/SusD family nutrient uptake outer membrane protein [Tannerellaceae bacterium]|nr:RagB/SusD family nutrient uptake outer membrane protein [Tannerellaceae bacterium]